MAQIPSYSTGSLKLSDYLIGTDVSAENVTRSMPVSDIVASILAIKSIGTVTSISTSNSTFINLAGGPITTTGSLTASLSASGTPSSATYLRGDGTWAEPGPTPTDIITYSTSVPLTTDTAQWKFTGTGVTASSINDNVKVDIPGLLASVDSVVNGVAITATGTVTTNPSTGNVTIVNSGVYQATAGGNVTLTGSATPLQYSSNVTVSTTANAGTIVSVNPGQGTDVTNNSTNPVLDVDYSGIDNFILANAETITSDDIIAFQDLSASGVKTAKLNTITPSSLIDVKNTIDTQDNGKVKNIDTFTDVWKAKQIVTLTISDYNGIPTKDKNTLYLISGPGTAYTATLNPTYNVTGGAVNVGYTTLVEVNDGTGWVPSSSLTAVAGTTYEFRITLSLINGYTLTSGSLTASTGTLTMPSSNTTDNLSITAVIQAPAVSQCLVTLSYNIQLSGPGPYWSYGGDAPGTQVTVNQGAQYSSAFNPTINATYGWAVLPTYTWSNAGYAPSSSTYTGVVTVQGTINGPALYSATLNVSNGSTLNVTGGGTLSGANITYSASSTTPPGHGMSIPAVIAAGGSYGWNNLTGTINGTNYSGTITFSSDVGGSSPITSVSGSIPGGGGNQTETIYAQGTITYTPVNPNQYRQADWLSQLQGLTTGSSNATFSNAQQGPVNGTTTYTYSKPTVTAGTGYRLTSSGTVNAWPTGTSGGVVTFNSTPFASGLGTSVSPAIENPCDITGNWTVVENQVTVVVSHTLCSACADAPTWQVTASTTGSSGGGGTNSQTWTLNGSGSQSNTFNIGGSAQVTFTISRTGAQYCLSSACMGGSLYQWPCPSNYRCPANNPKYSGSWTVTSPGSNTGNRSWTGASVNGLGTIIYGGTQAYASGLNNGDTVTLTLIEQ